jgi:thiamine biosynthesis lipoprotein
MYTGHKFVCWVVIFVFFHTPSLVANPDILLKKRANLMGSVFEISLVGTDSASLEYQIQLVIDEIERIENLISEWRPNTQISEVNRNAGIRPVKVDREVFELTRRAISYSILSDGAFDISVAALDKIWRFDGNMDALPSDAAVQNSVTKVGFEKIELDSIASTIFLKQSGMKIGFGSIGKAYAADRGRHILQEMGVKGGLINASGDIALWGKPPEYPILKNRIR